MMGVLNCTPDSFSDGYGRDACLDVDALVAKANAMVTQGADIIDVGGESTRPHAQPVSEEEELNRVIPIIKRLVADGAKISVDTMKAEVMRQAIDAGACMVNDITALQYDSQSLNIVAASSVDVCLMHMQGTPQTMQNKPQYHDVLGEVVQFFEQRIEACLKAGISASAILLDPGIGFGKRLEDNLTLIANLDTLKKAFAMPILLGTSRKSFLGAITGADIKDREIETAISSAIGIFCGADMIRIHDCEIQQKTTLLASALADFHLCQSKQEAALCL
jgi:dihydropteroate synthase